MRALAAVMMLLVSAAPVGAASCKIVPVTTWDNTIFAGPYRLLFDDHDPPVPHAYRWASNQAMRVAGPDGNICTAGDNVGIVTLPDYIAGGRYLYLDTYTGSDSYIYVLDAKNCRTIWQSPDMDGIGEGMSHGRFYLPSVGWLTIRPDCLPGKISGKPYPPTEAPP